MAEAQRLVRRLATARSLSTVVRTMKAFAALRIRQYQRAASALRGYDRAVELGFAVLLRHHPELLNVEPRASRGRTPPIGAVLIGTEHGLCGTFNERLVDFAFEQLGLLSGDAPPLLVVVGRRLTPALQRHGLPVSEAHELPSGAEGITPLVQRVLPSLEHWHDEHGVEWLYVMHHRLDESGLTHARARQLAPIDGDWLRELARTPWPGSTLPTFRRRSRAALPSSVATAARHVPAAGAGGLSVGREQRAPDRHAGRRTQHRGPHERTRAGVAP